jgi:RNA polymerase sigma factor (sigma-70 family)
MGDLPPDRAIIAASLVEPGKFGPLFDRHAQDLYRYMARRVGADLAEDLTAETFLAAFQLRDRYDASYPSARPWLFGIAANLIRRHRRTERRQLRAYARTGIDPLRDEFVDAERRVDAAAAGPRLADALASIAQRDREVLLLFAWADLSYEEIARALEIPVGTVRSRLARARARLRELVWPHGQSGLESMTVPEPDHGRTR